MPSQKELQEMYDNLDELQVGLKDGFRFNCLSCGKCCTQREDILLSPMDLFRIAHYLGKSNKDIIETYCDVYTGESSRIPIVRLMPKGENRDCPLLENNRCIVHAAKPSVCALFPLGRFVKFTSDDAENLNDAELQIGYLRNPTGCGGRAYNKVKRWLESFGIDPDDKPYLLWTKTTAQLGNFIRTLENQERKIPDAGFKTIWNIAGELLYLRYDTQKEFTAQFESNIEEMWCMIEKLDTNIIQPYLRGDLDNEPK